MKKLLPILFSLLSFSAFATHERAGEITFKYIGPGHRYEITITTYTKVSPPSTGADRCSLMVYFGDGKSALVCRSNFEPGNPPNDPWGATCNNNSNCPNGYMGEWNIGTPTLQNLDVKKNVYTTFHTYQGPNAKGYIVSMTDPDRNDDIVNVNNGTAFSIQDTLVILDKPNSSPILTFSPIDRACAGKLFVHNPGAVDQDIVADSLSYKLGVCFENVGTPVAGYWTPTGVSVNPITGNFIWNVPPTATGTPNHPCDEYNFAMDIEEWRKWPNPITGQYIRIGTVRRDMQVTVCNCLNDPPVIANVNDTCILANTNLTLTVTATDAGGNDIQSFTATGAPFSTTLPAPATFTANVPPQKNTATGIFSWTPSCNQVRQLPYSVTFRALDDGAPDTPPIYLSAYKTFKITVIAPAPKNLKATPQCTNMNLTWKAVLCNPASNRLLGYRIYRKIGCDTFKHGYCETGMPSSWGYSLIASVLSNTTSYTDKGLIHGNIYSYRVVAYYSDGAQSYVSNSVCNKLVRDVPIITNVDVISTGTNGTINVQWLKPDTADYDTTDIFNRGPYRFELMRATGTATPSSPPIVTFTSSYFATLNTTVYLDSPLNTQSSAYTYRVDFYDTSNTFCPAKKASSVFLSCKPSDNKIQLIWNEQVPWKNNQYEVYRYNSFPASWDFIGTTALQTFTDSGLANGANYCYKVKSIGAYPDPMLPAPLINWSQELCCSPVDLEPPCPVTLAVDSSCALSQNILSWNNPNNSCSDDAIYYNIYYMPVEGGEYSLLDTVNNINVPFYLHDSLKSIAGCYAVASVDSFGNESDLSNWVCIDNCPYYKLPNVFTPNGDGSNDFFTPLHPYKYVRDIDIKIYNRWGTEVFRTTNPEIMWDGISVQSKMLCSDGVYYYVCIVNDIRLKGIIPRALIGNVHLLSGK